jgi:hypothetical protein
MRDPEIKRAIVGAVLGFTYGLVLAFLSLAAAGAGHGTWIPFLLSSAPFGVLVFFGDFGFDAAFNWGAPVVWATFGALVAPSGRAKWLRLTQVLAALHYASGLALIAATTGYGELAHLVRPERLSPEIMLVWAAVYLVGQVTLWWRASRRGERGPTV